MGNKGIDTSRPTWVPVYILGMAGCVLLAPARTQGQNQPAQTEHHYTSNNTLASSVHPNYYVPQRSSAARAEAGATTYFQQPNYYSQTSSKSRKANVTAPATSRQVQTYAAPASYQASQVDASAYQGYAAQYQLQQPTQSRQRQSMSWPWSRKRQEAQVQTVAYAPQQSSIFTQIGKASWYGKDFHGGKTANGERYDMESLTAAHRTLPFGTKVKVTNMDNGQEVVVRINNRGPYLKDRIVDLSKGAAREIGILGKGIGRVQLQVLGR